MGRLLGRWLIATVAIFLAVYFIPGLAYRGPLWKLALVALIWGLVNALIRPVIELLTCPLILLTLGLFTFIINAAMLWLTAQLAEGFGINFSVAGFWPAFWGALLISLVSFLLNLLVREGGD